MRSKFPGYYKPTENEFSELWKNAIIVLDTNVLLDFYRYSDETVDKLINLILEIKDRIWIPYRVSQEYHENLNDVISTQINSYTGTLKTLEEFKKQLEEKRGHPFLTKDLHEEIRKFCIKFDDELKRKKDVVENLITDNPVKEKLAEILEGRIGDEFTKEELEKIFNDGVLRYADKIPPGFKDEKEKKNEKNEKKYGDLIIWKEVIKKSKQDNKGVILVTGDVKEDWFLRHSGKTIGPRPELIHEFRNEANNLFYMYPTNIFLEFANKYLQSAKVENDVLEEVKQRISDQQILSNDENSQDNCINIGDVNVEKINSTGEISQSVQNYNSNTGELNNTKTEQ